MLYIKVNIGEPLQSQAPEVRSDVPAGSSARPDQVSHDNSLFMVLLRRGAAAESGGKDGEGRSVTSLRRGSVQSLQRAGEHIYQARSLEVFIPAELQCCTHESGRVTM